MNYPIPLLLLIAIAATTNCGLRAEGDPSNPLSIKSDTLVVPPQIVQITTNTGHYELDDKALASLLAELAKKPKFAQPDTGVSLAHHPWLTLEIRPEAEASVWWWVLLFPDRGLIGLARRTAGKNSSYSHEYLGLYQEPRVWATLVGVGVIPALRAAGRNEEARAVANAVKDAG